MTSSIILDTIRDLVRENSESYITSLPVFNKSTYYIAGLIYALYKKEIDDLTKNMVDLLIENNYAKTKGLDIPNKIIYLLKDKFASTVDNFTGFYNSLEIEKTDIDNLLKSSDFGKLYKKYIENISGALEE